MSSQKNRQEEYERRLGAGTTRQANAEELLSELKRLLESSGHPPFAPNPPHRLRRSCPRLLQLLRSLSNRRTSTKHTTELTI